MTQTTVLPFAKFKPGMRVQAARDAAGTGTILAKHKGTETLTILWDWEQTPTDGLPAADYVLVPSDALDQVHPMLAKNINDYVCMTVEDLVENDQWVMERKYDGERQIVTCVPGQPARFTSRVVGKNSGRLGDNTDYLPHLVAQFASIVPTSGATVFDGELMSTHFADDEANFKHVASVMRSLAPRAREVQAANGWLSLRLYDLLWFDGADLRQQPFRVRREALAAWHEEVCDWFIQSENRAGLAVFAESISLSPQAVSVEQKQSMLDTSAAQGWEGVMLKELGGVYTDTSKSGRRSPSLLKHKPFDDTEVIIIEFIGGQGEYNTDRFGAMRFAQWVPRDRMTAEMAAAEVLAANGYTVHAGVRRLIEDAARTGMLATHALIEVGTASGFTQAQEAEFRATPDDFIAEVATVKFQSRITESGRMRHPHFKAMRTTTPHSKVVYQPK